MPEVAWKRYSQLIKKRRAETLTSDEHSELITLGDMIEQAHVKLLESVAELARLRCVPFDQMMRDLGIKPRRV